MGKNTGPRSERSTAMSVPKIATPRVAKNSARMLSHSPSRTAGNASIATGTLKKVCLTASQPGLLDRPTATSAAKTAVERKATAAERRDAARRYSRRSSSSALGSHAASCAARLLSDMVLLQHRDGHGLAQPRGLELGKRALLAQTVHGRGDRSGQRRALGQDQAELVAAGGALELAQDDAAVEDGCREVERRRQVHHERVDLVRLQGEHHVVVVVEHGQRVLTELLGRERVARGAGGDAHVDALEVGDGRGLGGGGALDGHD